jgi:hypothetical protein
MSKGNTWENDLLLLVFNNTNAANIGDATGLRGSTTVGSLFLSLHTADPGEAGDQTTSEATYTGYARATVARTTGGFTVSANAVTLVANIDFGACSSGTNTITHYAIGTALTGTGKVLYKGALSPTISVTSGVTPRILSGTIVTED